MPPSLPAVRRTDSTLKALTQVAGNLTVAAYAPASQAVFRFELGKLAEHFPAQRTPDNLTDEDMARYISMLFDRGLSPPSAQKVITSVRFYAKYISGPCPIGPKTEAVMVGFRRAGADRGRGQATGASWERVERAAQLAEKEGIQRGARDAALLSLGSDCLLRISELAAVLVSDIDLENLTLTIRRSKTDQEGEGAVLSISPRTAGRVRAWLECSALGAGALFRKTKTRYKESDRPLRPNHVAWIIKNRCLRAGVEGMTGHSLRVGGAQTLAAAGLSLVDMQIAGRWSSPSMPALYARGQMAGKTALAQLQAKQRGKL